MNLLFLDFDEVMTNILHTNMRNRVSQNNIPKPQDPFSFGDESFEAIQYFIDKKMKVIDPQAMKLLSTIIDNTESKIIISSTWKPLPFCGLYHNETMRRFNQFFQNMGYSNLEVIGITENIGFRGFEVALFLEEFSKNNLINNYIILDDGFDFFVDNPALLSEEDFSSMIAHNYPSEQITFEEYQKKALNYPKFWGNQKLLRINPLTGLSSMDVYLAISELNPKNPLAENLESFKDFLSTYKLYNSSEHRIKKANYKLKK